MSDGFVVDAGQMRAHAQHVRSLLHQVEAAESAAHQANFSSTMFGTIGSKLVRPLMAPLDAAGQESMSAIGEIFSATATAVSKAADEFEIVDGAVAAAWRDLQGMLP